MELVIFSQLHVNPRVSGYVCLRRERSDRYRFRSGGASSVARYSRNSLRIGPNGASSIRSDDETFRALIQVAKFLPRL